MDKIMFISVTNEATTAMMTTFLVSSFDDVWAFGMFELVFFEIVENAFVLAVDIGDWLGWASPNRVIGS